MPRPNCGTVDIVKRKDGLRTFYLRLTVAGRRERVRLGTDHDGWTPGRAQVALEEHIEALAAGTWTKPEAPAAPDHDPTFRVYASGWLEENMLEWRESTIEDVKWRLQSHLLPHVGDDRLSTFDIPKVTAVKSALLKESRRIARQLEAGIVERDTRNMPLRPLSNVSINRCLALLARILDDAVERGYLADNPARRVRRLRHHTPRRPVLEAYEVNAMFTAADRLDAGKAGLTEPALQAARLRAQGLTYEQMADRLGVTPATAYYRVRRHDQAGKPIPRFRVWVRLLCAVGLRIDEACRARRSDVDLLTNSICVGRAKTPAGVRRVQLTPDTAADLRRYLAMTSDRPDDGPLLPTRNGTFYDGTNAASGIITPLVEQTNVVLGESRQPPLPDGVTAHALRKTYFTFLHEAGAPPRWIADQGGHRDPSTSLRIYTESLRDRERAHHGEAFDALIKGAGARGLPTNSGSADA